MLTSAQRSPLMPLSAPQKSILYFEKLHPGTPAYNQTIVLNLENLNVDRFREAVCALEKRHEMLQYRLVESEGQIGLAPLPSSASLPSSWPLHIFDLSNIARPPVEVMMHTLKTIDQEGFITRPFALDREPLWRCALLRFSEKRFQFVLIAHHIIVDVSSKNILLRDLSELYNALAEKREASLPPLPELSKVEPPAISEEKLALWKKNLSDMSPLVLKTDYMPQTEFRCRGNRFYFQASKELTDSLAQLASSQKTSLHRIFLASLYILLHRHTGQTDICIGTASANRRGYSKDVEQVVSCFVNTIPLRVLIDGKMNFIEVVEELSKVCVSAYKNQLPFNIIARKAMGKKEKRKTTTASPFDIIFDLNQKRTGLSLCDAQTSYPSELSYKYSKFVLFGLNLDEQLDGSYRGYIEYNTDLFKESTMARMVAHLQNIWAAIIKAPKQKIAEIFFLTHEEHLLLTKSNRTQKALPLDGHAITHFFEKAVKEKGDKRAVVFHKSCTETEALTYTELHQKSNILASLLRAKEISPEKRVGVSLTRSMNLITTLWSVFKTGGVLLPLETEDSELLRYKVRESRPKVIIVDNTTKDLAIFKDCHQEITILNIDEWSSIRLQANEHGIVTQTEKVQPFHLAYITYTSGSTGKPKGVMSTYLGLTNAAMAIQDRGLKEGSKVLCTAKPNFDCFFFEVLEALMTSGELHLVFEEGRLSPAVLQEIISKHKINVVTLLPQISNYLDFSTLPSLNDIVIMGAIAKEETIKSLAKLSQPRRLSTNPLTVRIEYGVQEATIFSTEHAYQFLLPHTSIGKPIRNTQLFILDKDGRYECPLGVPGEVYIAGPSLARGYFNNPTLTDEKFVIRLYDPRQHKFTPRDEILQETKEEQKEEQKESDLDKTLSKKDRLVRKRVPEEKSDESGHLAKKMKASPGKLPSFSSDKTPFLITLYRTGDFARRLEDGSIDFIGRIEGNKQVKIHGVRIELDSMETILQQHPNIKDCLITFDPEKEVLKGYFILQDPSKEPSKIELNEFLRQYPLPHVARLNSAFFANKFPVNSNGKIDVAALEKAVAETLAKESKTEDPGLSLEQVPQSELHTKLKAIWEEVLDLTIGSFNDSFDELGGDSLDLIALEVQLNKKLPLLQKIAVVDLCFHMTIQSLSEKIAPLLSTNTHLFGNPSAFFDVLAEGSSPRTSTPLVSNSSGVITQVIPRKVETFTF